MYVIFYIDDGCLGPNGSNWISEFCRHFPGYLRRALGEIGVEFSIEPRKNRAEFRYYKSNAERVELNDTQIDVGLASVGLSRADFEEGLVELAVTYAASDEWIKITSSH